MHCQNGYYIKRVGYKYYTDDVTSTTNTRKLSHLDDFVFILDDEQSEVKKRREG